MSTWLRSRESKAHRSPLPLPHARAVNTPTPEQPEIAPKHHTSPDARMRTCILLLGCALAHSAFVPTARAPHGRRRRAPLCTVCAAEKVVPLEALEPSPTLTPREVISAVNAGLHRTNWDTPMPFYGFSVALRFLAPTHAAVLKGAKPARFSRFMRQPHKVDQTLWHEYRFDGELITLQADDGTDEAYQMVSMRSGPDDEWWSARWKLVRVDLDYGKTQKSQWMVEAVFANEPDMLTDVEFLAGKPDESAEDDVLNWNGVVVPLETPREVVLKVMRALRQMDQPYPLHGACVATRYCSPNNRAAELSPQVFASYLNEPGYALLVEWDEMQDDDDDDDDDGDDDDDPNLAEVDVLVRRDGDESFGLVSWQLSLHSGQWLIDSLSII